MDNSLAKALIMAAGILLAIIVVSFMVYSFRQLSSWSTTQEETLSAEQLEKFNKEYEVYDKDLMYGVDVISCLSKARSNNDKVEDRIYDRSYLIEVRIELKNQLEEAIRIYYMNPRTNKETEAHSSTSDLKIKDSIKLEDKFNATTYKDIMEAYGGISFSDKLGVKQKTLTSVPTILSFKGTKSTETTPIINAFLLIAGEIKQVATNPKSEFDIKMNNWTRAEWETPLYKLKTRKFKCTNIQYNEQNGRVNLIEFEEL